LTGVRRRRTRVKRKRRKDYTVNPALHPAKQAGDNAHVDIEYLYKEFTNP
jgi:hypothetical protein